MSWRRTDPHHPGRRQGVPNDRLEQARKAKADLLMRHAKLATERQALSEAETPSAPSEHAPPGRDVQAHLNALRDLPLWRLGDADALVVSAPYLRLAEIALNAMEDRDRKAVLCWPDCVPSPSAVSVLLALADCAAAPPIKVRDIDALGEPAGLRALIYPYAGTAHRGIRQLYVDKDYVGRIHTLHQMRGTRPGEDECLSDFHKALARSKTLTGRALDGQTYDEFRHPCLDEIVPFGPCSGTDGRLGVLWRVRTKTDLRSISRSGAADDPATARFFLFGLRANDRAVPALKAIGKDLDIVFLDLTKTALARLGRDWLPRIKEFLNRVDERVGQVATIALTDDPWTFDALRFDGLPRGSARKRKAPALSEVVFATRPDIVAQRGDETATYTSLKRQEVVGFSGETEGLLQSLRSHARKAEELADRDAADLLRQLIGTVRRCASLPAPRDAFSSYLESIVGGLGAADLQAAYHVTSVVGQLRSSVGPWAQLSGSARDDLLGHVERIWNNTADLTPMAPMLHDVIGSYLNKSSSTAVMFQKDMLADFAEYALSQDSEIGEKVRAKTDKGMLLFLDRSGLDDISSWPGPLRNYIKTLIAVAPTRGQILKLLARDWLPDNLIVLGDSDTLRASAADARRLADRPELAPIASRLAGFAEQAGKVVHRSALPSEDGGPEEDVEFPTSLVVNLAGSARSDQPIIRFRLSSDQVVIARPGTKLIVQDINRTVPVFFESDAKDVDVGDRLCVVGDAFLEMARPMLNIAVRAAEEIRDYHELVLERFAQVPGETQNAKLAWIVSEMALPEVSVQRARYWVELEAQRDVVLHEVVPHAPRDRETFLAFMKALSVSDAKSHHYWTWAVIAQRSTRLRAAISFHDAYRTILVDNYAAQSSDPRRSSEIRRLKSAAEDFVGLVVDKSIERGGHAAA